VTAQGVLEGANLTLVSCTDVNYRLMVGNWRIKKGTCVSAMPRDKSN